MKNRISRRAFLSTTAAAPVALAVANPLTPSTPVTAANPGPGSWVRWLVDRAPAVAQGVTWGTPWPRGKLRKAGDFALRDAGGKLTTLQSWPLAYWPDGSLKWTAHALAPGAETGN